MYSRWLLYIPVANEAAGLLTTFVRPSHIVIYAPRDSLTCRLPATSLNLSIYLALLTTGINSFQWHKSPLTRLACAVTVITLGAY
ncbi:hypothetical protein C9426_12120 [Serratia sp. S1B]|nr:hypothetical protein C9426_12120 [Serratia sp. S1B]